MSNEERQPLVIEVLKWDAHSFTIEGVNDQLERLVREQKMIRTLALMHNGKMVRISRDVKLKARKDFSYLAPELETALLSRRRIRLFGVLSLSMKDLTEFFLCPACDADLISVILVDFISDTHRRTMVTSGNSNNNIMAAKQKVREKLELRF